MQCYNPRLSFVNPKGGQPICTSVAWSTYVKQNGSNYCTDWRKNQTWKGRPVLEPFPRPCGKCEACRLSQARDYTTRAICELEQKVVGMFITATYSDRYLPRGGVYNERHIVRFICRLRDRLRAFGNPKITHFGCAEYGGRYLRPHFHLCIFGWSPPLDERIPWRKNQHSDGFSYRHELLEDIWNLGHIEAGDLTPASISYTARYVQKKAQVRSEMKLKKFLDFPEKKVCISRRPGIGRAWIEQTKNDLLLQNHVYHLDSKSKLPIPRYFSDFEKKRNPEKYLQWKARQRFKRLHKFTVDMTRRRLEDRRYLHQRKIQRLKRSLYD